MSSLDPSVPQARSTRHLDYRMALHPLHAFLLAGAVTLFVGGFLSDFAYFTSAEIQWKNFTSWLVMGALVFLGFSVLWAMIDMVRVRGTRQLAYLVLLVVVFVLGVVNELVHAEDAWASMPEGLVLSTVVALFAIAATVIGFSYRRVGVLR